MKKAYQKPAADVVEFRFSERIATSPTSCYWGSGATWTHGFEGCNSIYNPGTGGWIDNQGA